jgi:hypothetical protein
MRRHLAILLTASCVVAHAQEAPDYPQGSGYAGSFDEKHAREKQLEQIAIGVRVQQILKVASDRHEVQYAENRRRCQAALKVAELCGKFAGTFYCDEKGFQPIAPDLAVKPAILDNGSRYKMERCALDAAARNP